MQVCGTLNIQDAKILHLRTIAQLYRAISLQIRHLSTIGKKLGKQQYLLHKASRNMVNVGSQLRSIGKCGAPHQISTGFEFWFRYCTNVAQWRSTKLHDLWRFLGLVHYIYILGALAP